MEVEQEYEVEGREEEKKPSNPEQEREAILKMIAEMRITPPSRYPQKHRSHVLTDRDQP